MLQRQLLTKSGNPCKVFMCLELGFLPVKFVIMGNRLKYLNCILNRSMESMTRQVYETQKGNIKKGDFVNMVTKGKQELNIDLNEDDIKSRGKEEWKHYVYQKIKQAALEYLNHENSRME